VSRVVAQSPSASPNLYVLSRSLEQLQAALDWRNPSGSIQRPAMMYCEFEDIRGYPKAVEMCRTDGMSIALATIRVVKPNEQGLLKRVADAQPDAVLVRNLGGLAYFSVEHPQVPLIADYALNIANELTADLLLQRGVIRMTPSYDLNWTQYQALISRCGADVMEAVIHQHMPMFHMEHCVFAHTLSNGKDYRDCGRPCEKHQVELRDRAGLNHPLLADVGCRNTVFNGVAQSAAEYVPGMRSLGISHFRVELLRQPASEVGPLLDRYARVLGGEEDGRTAWRELKVLNQLGVTRGTLDD
jgi:U32 family peptidase